MSELCSELDTDRQCDTVCHGFCRHPPSCEFCYFSKQNYVLKALDIVQLAKLFVYTKRPQLADATFAVFLLSWIATRHVLYGILLWSVIFELPRLVPYDWRPRDGYFNSYASLRTFWALLIALQVIILIWFWMICRVAYKAIRGINVDDSRSDSGLVNHVFLEIPSWSTDVVLDSVIRIVRISRKRKKKNLCWKRQEVGEWSAEVNRKKTCRVCCKLRPIFVSNVPLFSRLCSCRIVIFARI